MLYYLANPRTEPAYNLALEQFLFSRAAKEESFFLLWRNRPSVILGRNQVAEKEVNFPYAREKGILLFRRRTGGGAVYHDLGNVNYSFICGENRERDFLDYCRPVMEAISSLGIDAEYNGRNDLLIHGRKFSGSAAMAAGTRVLHHGTLLFDADLNVMDRVLRIPGSKPDRKGVASVRSQVANIRPHLKKDMDTEAFMAYLEHYFLSHYPATPYLLQEADIGQVQALEEEYL